MVIASTKRVVVQPDVLANVIDGEAVLLNLKSECYFGLDEVGTRMWQVLTESESVRVAYETLQSARATSPGVLDRLLGAFRDISVSNLRMTGELVRLLNLFEDHGIVAIPYKGPTLAALAYGNLALREFEDPGDLLLHERDLAEARGLLMDLGFRLGASLIPAQEAAYVASIRELPLVSREGILVELHVEINPRDYGFPLDLDRLWERLLPVPLVGRNVPTFSVEDLLLILCAHGERHWWGSLGWICDLAELVWTRSDVRWEWVLDEARRLHGDGWCCSVSPSRANCSAHRFRKSSERGSGSIRQSRGSSPRRGAGSSARPTTGPGRAVGPSSIFEHANPGGMGPATA